MKVWPPIDFASYGGKVELANKSYDVPEGTKVTVIGWGATSDGGDASYVLRSVALYITDTHECARAYKDYTGMRMESRNQICAFGYHSGFCHGDSGGPLVTEQNIQVGIVFASFGCDDHQHPGISIGVSYYRDWIDANLEKW